MLGPDFKPKMTSSDDEAAELEEAPASEPGEMAEEKGEFETFASEALGTDDPAKLSALKEAIMACMGTVKSGGYDKGMAEGEGEGLSLLFGGKK
jgi:hypothetical protein